MKGKEKMKRKANTATEQWRKKMKRKENNGRTLQPSIRVLIVMFDNFSGAQHTTESRSWLPLARAEKLTRKKKGAKCGM
jgi:hypothetical protein